MDNTPAVIYAETLHKLCKLEYLSADTAKAFDSLIQAIKDHFELTPDDRIEFDDIVNTGRRI